MPAAWRWEASVLCIAGRGPLDDASAEMLAQLLRKHGLGSRALPHAAVSRAGLASLDVSQVAMICLSYLELEGAVSHLRYLLRRVRRRAPGIPVLVGLWPDEAEILKDDRLRAAVGADYYASTMRDAVEACLEAAHGGAAAQTGLRCGSEPSHPQITLAPGPTTRQL